MANYMNWLAQQELTSSILVATRQNPSKLGLLSLFQEFEKFVIISVSRKIRLIREIRGKK